METSNVMQAETEFRIALRLNHGNAEAHKSLARLLTTRQRTQEAIEHYLESLRIDPKLTLSTLRTGEDVCNVRRRHRWCGTASIAAKARAETRRSATDAWSTRTQER